MCPSKKLYHHFLGPFLIVERVSSHVFQLGLPLALSCNHPVFHVSLFQPTSSSDIPNRVVNPPPLMKLDNSNKWEVNQFLNSRFNWNHKGSALLYLIKWKRFDNTPNATSWEPLEHLENMPDLVEEFYQAYPNKLAP